ncbi:unnamed protein product [Cuscuta epithymum]|uniref:Uncharacterized protein n=1 Tax=Cuscuta epithymum TaxID=186058 RepID=A0AAV0G7W4_9ASTE|nr:unnamed protein product [Cuscuta epithymum]
MPYFPPSNVFIFGEDPIMEVISIVKLQVHEAGLKSAPSRKTEDFQLIALATMVGGIKAIMCKSQHVLDILLLLSPLVLYGPTGTALINLLNHRTHSNNFERTISNLLLLQIFVAMDVRNL